MMATQMPNWYNRVVDKRIKRCEIEAANQRVRAQFKEYLVFKETLLDREEAFNKQIRDTLARTLTGEVYVLENNEKPQKSM